MRLPSDVRMPAAGMFRFGVAAPAAAGTNQATATALTAQVNAVTAADGTKGVALPSTEVAKSVFVINTVSTLGLKVYPANGSGDAINALSADSAFTLGAGQSAWFVATSNSQWYVDDEASQTTLSGILATVAELNRAADVSTRNVALNVSTAITELAHDGKNLIMGGAGAARTHTLPAATGSGARFRFYVGAVNTSNHLVKVTGDDTMDGHVLMLNDTDATVSGFEAASDSDTITLNGTTTGGASIGDWVELVDIATDQWAVCGMITGTGSEATPFSATV